jgi:hypothetical protein
MSTEHSDRERGDPTAGSPTEAGAGAPVQGAPRAPAAGADVWALSVLPTPGVDLAGYHVEATDGTIGKVDEATDEPGASHLIVDTGPWIFGKKVMLPAGVLERIDADNETVFVNRSKDEIKNAPPLEVRAGRHDEDYREQLGRYYGGAETRESGPR